MKRTVMVAMVGFVALTSCNNRARGLEDSPINQRRIDHGAAEVIDMPNSFGNVAVKCDHHGHRIYATTQHAVAVIADLSRPADWNDAGR